MACDNPPVMTLAPGTRLGPYELDSPIGAGGMGEVWRARDTRLDRRVAIKLLSSGFAADAPGMTHLSDESGAVWRHFEVVQQSSFVLLDAKGAKVFSVGYGGSDDLADRVAAVAG